MMSEKGGKKEKK